jgi:hypothetical protein
LTSQMNQLLTLAVLSKGKILRYYYNLEGKRDLLEVRIQRVAKSTIKSLKMTKWKKVIAITAQNAMI